MSIFASQTCATVPVPFEAGQAVTIRKLTGREFERAQESAALALAGQGRTRSFAVRLRRILEGGASVADAEGALRDPLVGFDRFAVIKAGLISWTYPLQDGKTRDEQVEDLDDDAAEWLACEVLRLTKPELFEEGARKNG